jgi:histidinol-phosphate aminotransferase
MSPGEPRVSSLEGYHSPQVDVEVRLNTNESPYPPPAGYLEVLTEEMRRISWNRYPDRSAVSLREGLASFHGVDPAQVFCANGSNEVIQCLLLARGGPGRRAALFEPTYQLHSHISEITATPVAASWRKADFHLDLDVVKAACSEGADVLFLCSPNNPTGTVDSPEEIEVVSDMAPGLVLVDEAYGEFAPASAMGRAAESDRLLVCRTFSKVWSLAALRLGFLVGPSWLVAELEKVTLPYHLSAFTQVAGLSALRFPDEMHERVKALIVERERMYAELSARSDVEVWPSGANFLLFRPADRDGAGLWERLLARSVLVRDFSARRAIEGCLRVTVGTPEEDDRFLEALDASL